jgi:hypothetical protein
MDFFNMEEMALAAELDELEEKERKMNVFDEADMIMTEEDWEAFTAQLREQNRDTHGDSGEGWYGFDLDGTLAKYDGWKGIDHIGDPIKPMVDRIKRFHEEGKRVKIMTARVAPRKLDDGTTGEQYVTIPQGEKGAARNYAHQFIEDWCLVHLGFLPEIVHQKDHRMIELYDDRVKQVIPNEGILVEDIASKATLRKEVEQTVFDALHKGRVMRDCQRAYFMTRSGDALKASKQAEKEFDEALDFAAKCVQLGYVPKQTIQEELF